MKTSQEIAEELAEYLAHLFCGEEEPAIYKDNLENRKKYILETIPLVELIEVAKVASNLSAFETESERKLWDALTKLKEKGIEL